MQIEVIEVKPVDPPKEYLLKLDQNEVDFLVRVLGRIGGYDGDGGWKKVIEKMFSKLGPYGKITLGETMLDEKGHIKSNPPVKPK